MASTFERVAERATTFQPLRVLLSVLAAPFYALGWAAGLVWVALTWAWAAVLVGAGDAQRRREGSDDAFRREGS